MQTFLPYPDFLESARVLDNKRLGKQRVEILQLVMGQFPNHPAAKMWHGYRDALINYGLACCKVWTRERGFSDSVAEKLLAHLSFNEDTSLPPWFGNEAFHASHRSNLLRKDFLRYSRYGWKESPELPYIWPESDR